MAKIRRRGGYSCRSASIGSRRAARRAGKYPNTTPTSAEKPKATRTIDRIDHERHLEPLVGKPREPEAQQNADQAAEQRQHDRLDQKLHQHLTLECADGEPDADLARALRYRHQHDVHDADAADEQAHRGHRAEQAGQHRRRAGDRLRQLPHVANRKIVFLTAPDVAALAQQPLDVRLHLAVSTPSRAEIAIVPMSVLPASRRWNARSGSSTTSS